MCAPNKWRKTVIRQHDDGAKTILNNNSFIRIKIGCIQFPYGTSSHFKHQTSNNTWNSFRFGIPSLNIIKMSKLIIHVLRPPSCICCSLFYLIFFGAFSVINTFMNILTVFDGQVETICSVPFWLSEWNEFESFGQMFDIVNCGCWLP